jgi:hypothetical protein
MNTWRQGRKRALSPVAQVDMSEGGLKTRRRMKSCPTKIVAAHEELDE